MTGMHPLVSVITPTWAVDGVSRHAMLLERCIPSVLTQTYPFVEQIVVSDGPDTELRQTLVNRKYAYRVGYAEMQPHETDHRWGVAPRLRGLQLASGELIAYLDDDDQYRPGHIATLVHALRDHPECGFAYTRMAVHSNAHPGGDAGVIGGPTIGPCLIGTPMIMHRKELLDISTWGPPDPMEDWRLVNRWTERGVKYHYVDQVTVDVWPTAYRQVDADKIAL